MGSQWLMVINGQPMIAGTLLWNRQDLSKLIFAIALLVFFTVSNWAATCLLISRGNPMKSLVDGKIPSNPLKPHNWCCFSPHRCIKRPWKSGLWRCWSACCRGTCRDFDQSPQVTLGNRSRYQVFYQTPRCLPCFFCLYPQVCWYKRKQDWGLVKQQLQILEYFSCI